MRFDIQCLMVTNTRYGETFISQSWSIGAKYVKNICTSSREIDDLSKTVCKHESKKVVNNGVG